MKDKEAAYVGSKFPDHVIIPTKDAVFEDCKPIGPDNVSLRYTVPDTLNSIDSLNSVDSLDSLNSPNPALEGLIGEVYRKEILFLEQLEKDVNKRLRELKSKIDDDLPF